MARSGQYSVALPGGGGFRDAAALARGLGDALQRRPPVPASSPVPVLLLLPVLEPQRGGEGQQLLLAAGEKHCVREIADRPGRRSPGPRRRRAGAARAAA